MSSLRSADVARTGFIDCIATMIAGAGEGVDAVDIADGRTGVGPKIGRFGAEEPT